MSEVRSIAVVSAGLSTPSSTRMLADRITAAVTAELAGRDIEATARVFELRDVAHDITNHLLTGFAPKPLAEVNAAVAAADALLVVTPIFSTSYSGLFKSWLDALDRDALDGTPVLIGATAGTPRHSLAIDYAIRPLFTYLHAEPVTTGVFAASDDWGEGADRVAPLQKRIDRAARELADRLAGAPRRAAQDPYSPEAYLGGATSFADLLT
ncbi:MAG TPA: NAD(P)H-dependent oxidoreductase [Candidatus Microbacterium pullistercoris]|nr:NAD(P)H-dependent oxidoreductase [Candidatus Microbacterium pullistercoris]